MDTLIAAAQYVADHLDGFAGLAAFVNGIILWPIVQGQKRHNAATESRLADHEQRITALEPK